MDPKNELMLPMLENLKKEYEEDNTIPSDHPEKQRFNKMLDWLKKGGSTFDKLKIRFYSQDYRGVHAARDVKKGEVILFVPKE